MADHDNEYSEENYEDYDEEGYEDHGYENHTENDGDEYENTGVSHSHEVPGGGLDVPIDINVELGTLMIDTDSAMSMQEGDLLKLETSSPGEVSLVLQGREVGRGKLVDIDGYIGVQITHNWCSK